MKATPLYHDINGAPFKIGQRVKVIAVDEVGLLELVGQSGVVEYFEYSCGCGQSFPDDPMIGINFGYGLIEEFWKEELLPQTQSQGKEKEWIH